MATKNLVDDTSTTVTTNTPGVQLDLRYRTTLGRAALGVPVRMWVYAESTVANDTGTVQILDSSGAAKLTIPITGSTARWYATDGYLPALDAKYDAHYGGNTSGTLKVYAFTIHEFADISPDEGVLSASIGNFSLIATGTVASGAISGDMTKTIDAFTISATGTVASASPPAYVSAGTVATGTGALTPGGTSAAGNDVEILAVTQTFTTTTDATLSSAQGFTAVTGGAVNANNGAVRAHETLFWRRGGGSDPTVADNGECNIARIYKFSGCVTSGDPYDATPATTADTDGDGSLSLNGPTTAGVDRLVCGFVGAFVQATGASFSAWTNAALGSVTERDDTAYVVGGEDVHQALVTGTKATSGAVGSTTATISGAGSYISIAGVVIALKP